MKHISHRWSRRGLLAIALLAGSTAVGCNKKNDGAGDAKASASAEGATASAGTPCDAFAGKLCDAAGKESPTCRELKSAVELMPTAACTAGLANIGESVKKLEAKKQKCTELANKLCADLGPTTQTCEMVKTQTPNFPPQRCEMMLEHYQEVLKDLKRQAQGDKPLDATQQSAIAAATAPSFGPKDAKVTIVEFSDFQCPYCSKAADVAHKVREKYGDRVRFVFRQFPLSFHKDAQDAAEASLAAHAQGKFWQFHDRLFENQQALDRASLEKYAKDAGLDVATFKQALDSDRYKAAVESDLKLGGEVAVEGTPTMFLNGQRVPNPTDFDALSRMIDAALKS